jgi:hypothetical protein
MVAVVRAGHSSQLPRAGTIRLKMRDLWPVTVAG